MMDRKERIGIRIRTMRKSRRMTQEDLAKAIDQSPSSITMYETGRRAPDYNTLEALADVFNVPFSSLADDPDNSISFDEYLKMVLEDEVEQDLINTYRSLTIAGKNYMIQQAKIASMLYGKKSESDSAESV